MEKMEKQRTKMKTVLQNLIEELNERLSLMENTDCLEVKYIITIIEKRLDHEKKQMSDSFGMGMEIFAGQPVEYELDFEYYFNKTYQD